MASAALAGGGGAPLAFSIEHPAHAACARTNHFLVFEAAADCTLRGITVKPEVMIPLTGTVKELEWIQPKLEEIANAVMKEKKFPAVLCPFTTLYPP